MKKPKVLFLVHADYDALKQKNVLHLIEERDEYGFFQKVITIHPLSNKKQIIIYNESHTIVEFPLRKFIYKGIAWWLFLTIYFPHMLQQIIKIIKSEQINIIRATDPFLMGLIALIVAKKTKVPFCISLHCDYEKRFQLHKQYGLKKFLRIFSKWIPTLVIPRANLIFPIRECYIPLLKRNGASDKTIKIVPHGIHFDYIPDNNLYRKFNISYQKKIISFVGRLSKENYIEDILFAFENLAQVRSDFTLIIIGNGELEYLVRQYIAKYPNDMIKFLGFQSNAISRSIRYISKVSLCLMGGFSLIEAAAAACPVISYDVEWHYELIKKEETGILLKENDKITLISAINDLLDNPEKAKAMGIALQILARKKHDITQTTKIKQHLYAELIQKEK